MTASAFKSRITSEVFVSCPCTTDIAAKTLLTMLLYLNCADRQLGVAFARCFLVFYLSLRFNMFFLSFSSINQLLLAIEMIKT